MTPYAATMENEEALTPGQQLRARRTALSAEHGGRVSDDDELLLLAAKAAHDHAQVAAEEAQARFYDAVLTVRSRGALPANIARVIDMQRGHVHRMISSAKAARAAREKK